MSSAKTTDKRNVRNTVLPIGYCAVCGYCALIKFEFTGLFKFVFRF